MLSPSADGLYEENLTGVVQADESARSGISWAAIIAGAVAAVATSLLLLTVGAGFGFASVSPWRNSGMGITSFTVTAAIWLIVVQWVASGLGGYLTGRLRLKWVGTHTHEVFFRDTAHGFLSWCVATLFTAIVVASAVGPLVGAATRGATAVAGGAAAGMGAGAAQQSNQMMDPTNVMVDTLFRPDKPDPTASPAEAKAEAARIVVASLRGGNISPADRTYLAQEAAARTGISQDDAAKRVDDLMTQARAAEDKAIAAADQARKAAAKLALYTFFSMLIGAFIASTAAAIGGSQRDEW